MRTFFILLFFALAAHGQMLNKPSPQGASDWDYMSKRGKLEAAAYAAAESGASTAGLIAGLDYLVWARIVSFTAAAACGTFAVLKHLNSEEYLDKFNDIIETMPETSTSSPVYKAWYRDNYDDLKFYRDRARSSAVQRNIYSTSAGTFAFFGVMTFFF